MKSYVTFCLQAVLLGVFPLVETLTERLQESRDVHSCLFHIKMCLCSNLSCHIKERLNGIYCLNFQKENGHDLKDKILFFSKSNYI